MKKFYAVSVVFLLLAAGCKEKDKVVAKIGSDTITLASLSERIKEAPPAYQGFLSTAAGKKQFLDLMVRERIVLESARQAGVEKNAEYTRAMVEFKKDQARRLREYQENLLMELHVRDLHAKQLAATDKDVDKYYQEHKSEYDSPVEVVARHILVTSKAEAEKVLERLKAGADFAKTAGEVSTDPVSASRGGEIGPFRKGDLVPEFEQAVFPLKVNGMSGIVETQFGFHIIKKVAEKALPALSADEAKLEIKKLLEKTTFDTWLNTARKKFGVNVAYDLLARIPSPQAIEPAPSAGPLRSAAPKQEPAGSSK